MFVKFGRNCIFLKILKNIGIFWKFWKNFREIRKELKILKFFSEICNFWKFREFWNKYIMPWWVQNNAEIAVSVTVEEIMNITKVSRFCQHFLKISNNFFWKLWNFRKKWKFFKYSTHKKVFDFFISDNWLG